MPTTYDRLVAAYGDPHQEEAFFARACLQYKLPADVAKVWPPYAGNPVRSIQINKALVGPLLKVFAELVATGLVRELKTYDGGYKYRPQRGSTRLSMHSFGVALDFNAATNGLGKSVTFSAAFLGVWRKHGWTCGADFKMPRTDGMHMEYTITT